MNAPAAALGMTLTAEAEIAGETSAERSESHYEKGRVPR